MDKISIGKREKIYAFLQYSGSSDSESEYGVKMMVQI